MDMRLSVVIYLWIDLLLQYLQFPASRQSQEQDIMAWSAMQIHNKKEKKR